MAKVYGTKNLDVLDGFFDGVTDGDDTIFGLGGDDWINGQDGNDILQGGEGADKLNGGDGIDTANYGDSPVGVQVNLQTGQGHWGTAQGDLLWNIENLTGSWWNDYLIGNGYDNVLSGSLGNDDLQGNAGADTLDGGWGVDRAIYSDSSAGVTVSLLWDFASGGDAEGDELNSIESLYGSDHDDGLFGDNGANSLQGSGGKDTLLGFGDADFLEGGSGKDSLNGGAGNDILYGGRDADTLAGGPGADKFVWSQSYFNDYESAGVTASGIIDFANMDVILDFNFAEGDRIDLLSIDANVEDLAPYPYSYGGFDFIGEYFAHGGFTAPGQAAYTSDATDTYLIFNTDAVYTINDVAEFEFAIKISGVHTPDASWFV